MSQRKEFKAFEEAVSLNAEFMLKIFTLLPIEALGEVARTQPALFNLFNPEILKRVKFGTHQIPSVLLTRIISQSLQNPELASVSQVNTLFRSALTRPLEEKKEQLIRQYQSNVNQFLDELKEDKRLNYLFSYESLLLKTIAPILKSDKVNLSKLLISHFSDLSPHKKLRFIKGLTSSYQFNISKNQDDVFELRFYFAYYHLNQAEATSITQTYNECYPKIQAKSREPLMSSELPKIELSFNLAEFLRTVILDSRMCKFSKDKQDTTELEQKFTKRKI